MQTTLRAVRRAIVFLTLLAAFGRFSIAQAVQPIPSEQEIDELASKADQKIRALQGALAEARQEIEKHAPDLLEHEMDTISTALGLIRTLKEKGPSAYRLVVLNVTLDDISRASLLAVIVAVSSETALTPEQRFRLTAVTSAELTCFDISELLSHATLRLIKAEEDIIGSLPAK